MKKCLYIILSILLLVSCKQELLVIHDVQYITKDKEIVRYDSVYIDRYHDVFVKGDTVYVDNYITQNKYKYIYKTDTFIVKDTVVNNIIKEVIKKEVKWFPLWISLAIIVFVICTGYYCKLKK